MKIAIDSLFSARGVMRYTQVTMFLIRLVVPALSAVPTSSNNLIKEKQSKKKEVSTNHSTFYIQYYCM